jgi:predicted Fe-Mo cluster-binding NifX family protein
MKIAVTYDENQEVFQHFGHTEHFKVFEIENNTVISSKVISSDGEGHSALALMLENENIDKLICGGIGGCAVNALGQAGIEIFAGISGKADDAVQALINGTLEQTTSPICNHHGHDHSHGHSCGHSCH